MVIFAMLKMKFAKPEVLFYAIL